MKSRTAGLVVFGVLGALAASGQIVSPAKLPSSAGCTLPPGAATTVTCVTFGAPYTISLNVSTPPSINAPTWSISSGFLPPGLNLDQSGTISGSPSSGGLYTFTISAVYSDVNVIVTSPFYTIATQSRALSVTQIPLPTGNVGIPITPIVYTASGGYPFIDSITGFASYQWSFGPGTNADGLSIDAKTGIVSGTPVNPGSFPITIGAIDSLGQGAIYRTSLVVTTSSAVSITSNATLPAGTVGTLYNQNLTATGGATPYTWSLISGALPPGLSLSSTGNLTGTPTSTGTLTFGVRVTDANASSATLLFSLTINPSGSNFSSALRTAQIVDGGGWKTLFAIVNLDSVAVSYTFQFWDDNGAAFPIPIVGGSPGLVSGTLAPGGVAFAETPGTALSQRQGWAEIASSGRLGVEAIFKYTQPGVPDSQGTVTAVPSSNNVYMPFDNTSGYTTGVAIANTNATQPLTISMIFTTDTGSASTGTLTLPAHGHSAFVLPTLYSVTAGKRGTIRFTAPTADITVSGFRFTPSLSFTSLDSMQ